MSFFFVVKKAIDSKRFIGIVKDSGCFINVLKNRRLTWSRNTTEVLVLMPEQIEWLMKGFTITSKIAEGQKGC